MGRRAWISAGVAALVSALCCSPAWGVNQTVTARPSNVFEPASVTIMQGETVTWANGGGFHNVHFDDNSFIQPAMPSADPWIVPHTFAQPGTYTYYCEAHV